MDVRRCRDKATATIRKEEWRLIFDRADPELRCAACGHGDFDVED